MGDEKINNFFHSLKGEPGVCSRCGEQGLDTLGQQVKHLHESNKCAEDAGLPTIENFHELYMHIGRIVRVRGRVVAAVYKITETTREPTQVVMLDSLTEGEGTLQVHHRTQGDKLPSGVVECIGMIPDSLPEEPEDGGGGIRGKKKEKNSLKEPVLFAYSVKQENSAWENYSPSAEELEQMALWKTDEYEELKARVNSVIAPNIAGRSWEKLTASITAASPIYPAPGLRRSKFCLKTILAGKWREGKDAIIEHIAALCPEAITINGENCSQAGLVGGVVMNKAISAPMITWGGLVQANGGLARISGVSGLSEEHTAQLREVLATGVASVDKIARGKKPAHARMLMSANTNQPMDAYPSYYTALRDIGCNGRAPFKDGADFCRLHIPVPIADSVGLDVQSDSQFMDGSDTAPEAMCDALQLILRDAWARQREGWACDLNALRTAKDKLCELAKPRRRKLPLAIFEAESIYILYAISAGFAALAQRRNAEGRIYVDATAIGWGLNFIYEMLERLNITEALKSEAEQDNMAEHAAELMILAIRQEQEVPVEVDTSEEEQETAQILNDAYKHRGASMKLLKLLGVLSEASEPLTWGRLGGELEEGHENLKKQVRFAQTWIEGRVHAEGLGQIPDIYVGTPNKGVKLTSFGMRILKFLVHLNSGNEFYEREYPITRIICIKENLCMWDREDRHECKVQRLLE